jgi:SAM-dependent methyltransferase
MNDPVVGKSIPRADEDRPLRYYKKDFWSEENLKFSRPGCRLEKAARLVSTLAGGQERALLDVGCGPAALMTLLPANVKYHGIDIAVHSPAPNLLESDILSNPIRFGDKRFDIVVASGVFEYLGDRQVEKLSEIAKILKEDGKFIVSYTNFSHRSKDVYWVLNNVQPLEEFRHCIERYFTVDRCFPVGHNWGPREPNRRFIRFANMHINRNIPFVSHRLAVEYFFICSPRDSHGAAVAE